MTGIATLADLRKLLGAEGIRTAYVKKLSPKQDNGKNQIYEEDIRVPLLVRGPGVPAGVTRDHYALNIDLAPTFAKLGAEAAPNSAEEFTRRLQQDLARWTRIRKETGLKIN